MDFSSFMARATGGRQPFPYQQRFALGRALPSVVRVPTGLGKTAMAILGWLWRRRYAEPSVREATPRRCAYCLPMRVLVEQTRAEASKWLSALALDRDIGLHVLMGGEDADDWDLAPERDAILVGTQDMLLSAALNRGYGASRARWPLGFGLLNNDCLWFIDEVQLAGCALPTTAQLEAFRHPNAGLRVAGLAQTVWMSATLDPAWLRTVDLRARDLGSPLELDGDDLAAEQVLARVNAQKTLVRAPCELGAIAPLAKLVRDEHESGTLTIVVVNTVDRAIALYDALTAVPSSGRRGRGPAITEPAPPSRPAPTIVLLHSRFRPRDRERRLRQALVEPAEGGTIIVSTQVIEAGMDLSARRLYTELSPWASIVQRLGRLNRRGEHATGATAIWIDLPREGAESVAPPYELAALEVAADALRETEALGRGAGPRALEAIGVNLAAPRGEVLRRTDLIDLFDTTPDLAGNDISIDRYVRDADDTDAQVFWRTLDAAGPSSDLPAPLRSELCRVGVGRLRDFLVKLAKADPKQVPLRQAFRRRWLDGEWEPVRPNDVLPGQAYLLDARGGGYDANRGWTGDVGRPGPVPVVGLDAEPPTTRADTDESPSAVHGNDAEPRGQVDDNAADPLCQGAGLESIADHTDAVCAELQALLESLGRLLDPSERDALERAARWHDRGKAHPVFQAALPDGQPPGLWAKAHGRWRRYKRKGFRHELASALAVLEAPAALVPESVRDLVAYLVAAHHGKVRLSIRSLPEETRPEDPLTRFARGIWEGDLLPATLLGASGPEAPPLALSLALMEIGGGRVEDRADGPHSCKVQLDSRRRSWLSRTLELRDARELGPFRLAYLETLLRAADVRASRRAQAPQQRMGKPR